MDEQKCENYREYLNMGYCIRKNLLCLQKKYGVRDTKEFKIKLPYDKIETILFCDGILPKEK